MGKNGLIILYTGNGKGKTTAALGQALRAAGQGLKVCIIQFIKGRDDTGEVRALARLGDMIELHTMGSGFTWAAKDPGEPKKAAIAGWALARKKIMSNHYDLVILDEFTYALNFDYLAEPEVLAAFKERPRKLHLLITGRDAGEQLLAAADLVTEMREIKHPFQQGERGRRGIEF
ncbi:MAG: cob(I)yrinic acid a,c-diamide adenosyltransferase [Desulfobacterales bacterium]|nr:cob(I)yrinic acid a,c-diamide adenosyltransferase [Desulfobacterales bacterium]